MKKSKNNFLQGNDEKIDYTKGRTTNSEMKTKPIKQIIDLKELSKYITANFGKRCEEYEYSCLCCRTWRIFDDINEFMNSIIFKK